MSTLSDHLEPERFDSFPQLPGELRNRVWMFASPCPKVVTIDLQNNKINKADSTSQALFFACRESRGIYLENNKDFIQPENRPERLAVNFQDDYFHLIGLESNDPNLDCSPSEVFCRVQKL